MRILQLKKWYSDFVSDGGAMAGYTYIMAIRLAGVPFGNVAVHLTSRNGEEYRYTKTYRIDSRAWRTDPIIGGSSIRSSDAGSAVSINIADLSLTLDYSGRDEAWSPAASSALLDDPRCRINWIVLQSGARIRGTLHAAGRSIDVSGQGYRDLVTMSAAPWAFPGRRLLWGRAHCGEYSVVFNRLELDDKRVLSALLVRKGGDVCLECGGVAEVVYGREGATEVSGAGCVLTLVRPRILERAPVFTSDRIRPEVLRSFMRKLSRDPLELKLFSDATFAIHGKVVHGHAIHELVSWDGRSVGSGA